MACTRPLNGWMSPSGGQWKSTPFHGAVPSQVPCGQCIGCRLNRSRGWAVRGQCEASLYAHNCFITLTYADKNLHYTPSGLPNLHRRDITLFLKRLRKKYPHKIRYFGCGEYGSKLSLHDRNRVSSTLLMNSCQGRTSSIAAQGSSPDSLALSNTCPTVLRTPLTLRACAQWNETSR